MLFLFLIFVSGTINAQTVNISDANLKYALVNYLENEIVIDINNDNEIQISEAQAMQGALVLYGSFNDFTGLESFSNIETLDLHLNAATEAVVLSGPTQITTLWITGTGFNVDISAFVNLEQCALSGISYQSLDFSIMPNLSLLGLDYADNLTSLFLDNNSNLTNLTLNNTALSSVDLSGSPNMSYISIHLDSEEDTYINLKNGNSDYYYSCNLWYNGNGRCYVCIDEGEEINIGYFGNTENEVLLSSYCSFTPGGAYNTITGMVTFDSDNNGCNSTDAAIPFTSVQLNDGTANGYSWGTDGGYNFYTQAGTFIVTPQFNNGWFTASPATVTFADNNNNIATQNFCVTANGVHPDAEVVIVPIQGAQPGFDSAYKIMYKNNGNQTLSGDITFTYNDAVLDYVSASPAETTAAAGSLAWSYTGMQPFESREILLTLNVNSPMETPAVNIDDVLNLTAGITPLTGDDVPENNTFALNQVVVGSFDPNDITCLEGEAVNPVMIGQYLHYNINFENTGTAPATFVVVKDVINEAQFDVSSLRMLDASHDVETRVTGNKVEFYFNDINLPANGGKGNVAFKIKTLSTLQVNDDVTQQAEIFFDYNWPIVTNEATTVFDILSAGVLERDTTVRVYPNPAVTVVTISGQNELQGVELYDIQGRLLQATNAAGTEATFDMSNRASGLYFMKIRTEKGIAIEKLVKN